MTIYHLVLEATLGLTTFKFATDFLERNDLLHEFVEGYSKIHHDETRHIGYGVWFLRETVATHPDSAMWCAACCATCYPTSRSLCVRRAMARRTCWV